MNEKKMTSKESKSSGSYVLAFLTIFNFATLAGIVIYHLCYVDNQTPQQFVTNTKDLVDSVVEKIKSELKSTNKRRDVYNDFLKLQNSELLDACRSTCHDEVVSVLKDAVEQIKPATTVHYKRQVDTTGNELASIFGEIAKTEIDILNRYCTNGSAICLPGAKGDQGIKGDRGLDGTSGKRGDKGEPGVKGDTGQNGTVGLKGEKGDQGLQGLKGDPGTDGIPGQTGLTGSKGDKGDKGDAGMTVTAVPPAPPTPFILPTQTVDSCCTRLSPPEFTSQLEELKVPVGTDLNLQCKPGGYPPPKIQWKWSPASTLDKVRSRVTPDDLTINNAEVNDTRLYTCFVENALGRAEKQYSVTVYPHINFEQIPQNSTVLSGTKVFFECKVDGPLNPTVTWYKVMNNGNRIPLTSGVTAIQLGSRLEVASASSVTSGEYVCVGDNGIERIETSSYLNIYGPPTIISPGTVTVIKGQQAVLKCDAIAFPPATITWTYPPGVTNAYINTDGSLVILDAQTRDATTFFCTATNKYGQDKDSVRVEVKVPAEVTVSPVLIPLGQGTTNIAIQCNPGGDQPLSVSFAKDGQTVTSDGHILTLPGNVLLVNAATQTDAGEYTCIVSNSLGTSQASAYAFNNSLGALTCADTFQQCSDTVCGATCPPDCNLDSTQVFGLMQYSMDSSICRAAIQSGAITTNGGQVVWAARSNMTSNTGGNQNGIASQPLSINPGDLTAVPIISKP